ncbi:hypothetical protein KIH86_23845 [Paenibacillus sp. HN-1]|uniref:hypothetical protein n=1 Tax=Paenibacillus TaxID=44249 RepID=UPI001CA9A82B|nr:MULTISPECIES: hypothetical protein [Paenibacillus]MBY9081185.1 hypothetical protein [Paenibacillus sp. CGMCC 1.18879]MBY9087222.1 hypothetical protein [Paenibacillus sinensis]
MTYSQMSHNSGRGSDIRYLEEQIAAVKQEIARAKAAGLPKELDEANNKLAELEAELDKLED